MAGRALLSHSRGARFDPGILHHHDRAGRKSGPRSAGPCGTAAAKLPLPLPYEVGKWGWAVAQLG